LPLATLLFDLLGVIEEPVELQVRLPGIARVVALVPDAHAHLEEPDRIGVAAGEVVHPGLDERGHHRKLGWQAALVGRGGHPRGDLL
jgi:hypothetical protein